MGSAKKYYAVARGVRPGLYRSWSGENGAEAQVRGFPGAVFKSFSELEDALDYLYDHGVRVDEFAEHRPRKRYDDGAVHIFTDGASLGNPGPGGYGAVVISGDKRNELSKGFRLTTNNRMELMACIAALESLPSGEQPIIVHSDSRYVVDNLLKGNVRRWQSNGWVTAGGEPVKNADLWKKLMTLVDRLNPQFVWVKGHGGASENERCDQLAQAAAASETLETDKGFEIGD